MSRHTYILLVRSFCLVHLCLGTSFLSSSPTAIFVCWPHLTDLTSWYAVSGVG